MTVAMGNKKINKPAAPAPKAKAPVAKSAAKKAVTEGHSPANVVKDLKYTDAQINRLFIEGSDSVLERAAHIAAAARAMGNRKGIVKKDPKNALRRAITEGEGFDTLSDDDIQGSKYEAADKAGADEMQDYVEQAANLMDSLFGPLDQIKSLLAAADGEIIDILLDHLDDLTGLDMGGDPRDDEMYDAEYKLMSRIISLITGK